VKRRRSRDIARVHVPTNQAPLFNIPGPHGGWYVSVLFAHGYSIDVPMQELRELLAGSRGEVIVARRLTRKETRFVETKRAYSNADVHASLIVKEEERFRRPRFRRPLHGDSAIDSTKGGT